MAKVILGLSGGVDSSVAAIKLLQQGYEVEGLFMRKIIIAALILAMSFSLAGCSDITWLLDLNHSCGSSRSAKRTYIGIIQ